MLSFQTALSAVAPSDIGLKDVNLRTAAIAKDMSTVCSGTVKNCSDAAVNHVSKPVEVFPSGCVAPVKENESISTVQKESTVLLKNDIAILSDISSSVPILDKLFLGSYLIDGVYIDLYLDDIGNGQKEIIFEYVSLCSERKTMKTGLFYDEANQIIFGKDEKGMLGSGFDFDIGQKMFFYSENVFQRNYGFCELYDILSPLIMDDLITTRIKFNYEGMDWMVQLWKGRYITTMGGEIGIYNKPDSRKIEFYDCGRDQDRMPISMSVSEGEELLFTRKTETCWWQTGFVFREFCAPEALTLKGTICFPTLEMKNAFTTAADKMTTEKIAYTVEGNTVSFVW